MVNSMPWGTAVYADNFFEAVSQCRETLTLGCPTEPGIIYIDKMGLKEKEINISLLKHFNIYHRVTKTPEDGYGIYIPRTYHRVDTSFRLLIARISINNIGYNLVERFYNVEEIEGEDSDIVISSYYGWKLFKHIESKMPIPALPVSGPVDFLFGPHPELSEETHPLFDKFRDLEEAAYNARKIPMNEDLFNGE